MSMTVTCPSCSESFPVDPAKIPAGGIKARCSSCQGIIEISPPDPTPDSVDSPTSDVAPDGPEAELAEAAPGAEGRQPETPRPEADMSPAEESIAPVGGDVEVGDDSDDGSTDIFGEREITFDEPLDGPSNGSTEAPADESVSAGSPPATEGEARDADSVFASVSGEAATPSPAPDPQTEETEPKAPIQFGKRSPEDKARSLARSLVSDIIAYHQEKHQQAKAAGDLPEVFEEEVEKCWKEYQEQVDPGVVQNNSFFNDALNDILADGESVFNMPG